MPENSQAEGEVSLSRTQFWVLTLTIFVAGLCSIVYELLIGATSSYFLGDSIKQFSLTIGLFMAAMGLGSFISKAAQKHTELAQFVRVELALGLVGGASTPLLYLVYAYTDLYYPVMLVLIIVIGALTGLEIPLLVRMMRRYSALENNLANTLSVDYLGALAATLLFPFVLLPVLGTFRSALAIGLLNVAVAALVVRKFPDALPNATERSRYRKAAASVLALLLLTFGFSEQILRPWRNALYEDRVIFSRQTPYQRIVMTRGRKDVRLFLNGNLQFSSIDEYRYHEALVHPAMAAAPQKERVLLLGGGDGMAVREVLKYPKVKHITLVDLDPEMIRLGKEHPALTKLSQDALRDPKVELVTQDAFKYLESFEHSADVIIIDLPDPNNASLSRLYSREFYKLVKKRLARTGVMVTQATSPFFAKEAFWCIHDTARRVDLNVRPYHVYVPSFGDWGFVMASAQPLPPKLRVEASTRYLNNEALAQLFVFEKDLQRQGSCLSTLDEPQVLSRYLNGWKHWN